LDVVLRVEVHVRPGSKFTTVGSTHDGALVVRVTARAHDGRANAAVLRALADALHLPRQSITLAHGETSRRKVIAITLSEQAEPAVRQELSRLCSS
jgi:uncharacterized protein YggU (UPF0235/DUF167 family)